MTRHAILAGLAVAALAGAANAATVKLDFLGVGPNQTVRVKDNSSNVDINVAAGALRFRVLAGGTSTRFAPGRELLLFCTDLTQHAGDGMFNIAPLASAPQPGAGMGKARAAVLANLYSLFMHDALTSPLKAAGFQLAVWEIANEAAVNLGANNRAGAGLDAHAGDFRGMNNTSARNQANLYLDSAFSAFRNEHRGVSIAAAVSNTRQDQILIIPTPTGASMAAAGLLGLAARRRR